MLHKHKKDSKKEGEIFNIPPHLIYPNPNLSRTEFPDSSLAHLADSIRRHGIIQPLAVCTRDKGGYEILAGERRLRAAVLMGFQTVPCILVERNRKMAEYLSAVENLQREKLNIFDEAKAIKRLFASEGEEKAAELLSIGKEELVSKIRLTEFSKAEAREFLKSKLSSEMAEILLLVPKEHRISAIKIISDKKLDECKAEQLCRRIAREGKIPRFDLEETLSDITVEKREEAAEKQKTAQKTTIVLKDLRSFENSIKKTCELLGKTGLDVETGTEETNKEMIITIKVIKQKQI